MSTETLDPKIVSRIQKLLAMSTSSNKHEAEIHLSKAMELMTEHNLSMQVIENRKDKHTINISTDYTKVRYTEGAKASYERSYVCAILRDYFFVEPIAHKTIENGKKVSYLSFIGKKSNVEVATYVYGFLCQTFRNLWKQYHSDNNLHGKGDRTYFYKGLYAGLNSKFGQARKQVEQTMALVIVKDSNLAEAVSYHVGKVRSTKSYVQPRHTNTDVYYDGVAKGRTIEITPALGNGQ
jgi:hypothetical protein